MSSPKLKVERVHDICEVCNKNCEVIKFNRSVKGYLIGFPDDFLFKDKQIQQICERCLANAIVNAVELYGLWSEEP